MSLILTWEYAFWFEKERKRERFRGRDRKRSVAWPDQDQIGNLGMCPDLNQTHNFSGVLDKTPTEPPGQGWVDSSEV